jgi:hypothetical protein
LRGKRYPREVTCAAGITISQRTPLGGKASVNLPRAPLVDTALFDKMSNQWREEQNRCQREIDRHQSAEQSYMDEGVQILELARNAQRLFERQEPRQKRRLSIIRKISSTHSERRFVELESSPRT